MAKTSYIYATQLEYEVSLLLEHPVNPGYFFVPPTELQYQAEVQLPEVLLYRILGVGGVSARSPLHIGRI